MKQSAWDHISQSRRDWRAFLGSSSKNLWDCVVPVCLVLFHMSVRMLPLLTSNGFEEKFVVEDTKLLARWLNIPEIEKS